MTRARGATALIARMASGQGRWSVPACMSTAITVRDRPISLSPDRSKVRSTDQQKSRPIEFTSRRSFEKSPRSTTHPLLVIRITLEETIGTFRAKVQRLTQPPCTSWMKDGWQTIPGAKIAIVLTVWDPPLDPLLPQQPDFDHLRKAHIGEQREHQDRPVHPRQVCETQRRSQWGIGQPHAEGHDG